MKNKRTINTKICIIGAGPGGAATALKLSYMGIPCVLIDKATFPRDKTCGDAISGKVTTLLNRLDPAIMNRFAAQAIQYEIYGIKFVVPNGRELDIPFQAHVAEDAAPAPGYVSKRVHFDNFLIEEVKRRDNISFYDHTDIESYEKTDSGFTISDKSGDFVVETQLLIVANGAHSAFSRKYAGLEKDLKHHAAAVRAYYKNVGGLEESTMIELHFLSDLIPGYFWVFPLPNGEANVGVGMRGDIVKKRKLNLKKELDRLIETHPKLRERFKNAERISGLHGYGLPLGSKKRTISGDHFMLIGDAGHLVDPMTGEGIGNAFYSGFIAAELAEKCFEANDFSAEFMKAYDVRVARVLGSEMRLSYQIQRMLSYQWIVNFLANVIAKNAKIIDVFQRMYTDFDLRKKLVTPWFWLKMMFKGGGKK